MTALICDFLQGWGEGGWKLGETGGEACRKAFQAPRNPRGIVCMFKGTFFRDQSISPGVVHAILTNSIHCAQQSIPKLHQAGTSACQAQAVDGI